MLFVAAFRVLILIVVAKAVKAGRAPVRRALGRTLVRSRRATVRSTYIHHMLKTR